ncbi:thiamine pyrophosphate-binding protein [Samsonia erythrinae]|uniref:Sulfopyruvate decarboxylase subunit alpha n=1 Tax=Samsonia erythrinae TaxID=160434 RepID=A0A4R3VQ03_9GAMM|nr:thiamine pyrophosphate-binding protein [Samsonia erythrinae]TCV06335.1 sulfopyruvate decarboxylase subunit alpha [Samsonia erythrinae]
MTIDNIVLPPPAERARQLAGTLNKVGITSQVGTPCGILAPLWKYLDTQNERERLITISREDTALSYAAGQALAGGYPAVFMQNSGFGNCVNIMASLICPFKLRVVLIISLRGTGNDTTPENTEMGKVTASILEQWKVPIISLLTPTDEIAVFELNQNGPMAILISPEYFGWCP